MIDTRGTSWDVPGAGQPKDLLYPAAGVAGGAAIGWFLSKLGDKNKKKNSALWAALGGVLGGAGGIGAHAAYSAGWPGWKGLFKHRLLDSLGTMREGLAALIDDRRLAKDRHKAVNEYYWGRGYQGQTLDELEDGRRHESEEGVVDKAYNAIKGAWDSAKAKADAALNRK